jgi:hypothetical protein
MNDEYDFSTAGGLVKKWQVARASPQVRDFDRDPEVVGDRPHRAAPGKGLRDGSVKLATTPESGQRRVVSRSRNSCWLFQSGPRNPRLASIQILPDYRKSRRLGVSRSGTRQHG